jgi:hypothetical protein
VNFFQNLVPSGRKIIYSRKPELDEVDQAEFQKIVEEYYDKYSTLLHKQITMHLDFKEYKKGTGLRRQHEILCKVSAGGMNFAVKKTDWRFMSALHDTMKTMTAEIIKKTRQK